MKYRKLTITATLDNSKSDVDILNLLLKTLRESGSTKHRIEIETTEAQLRLDTIEAERLR